MPTLGGSSTRCSRTTQDRREPTRMHSLYGPSVNCHASIVTRPCSSSPRNVRQPATCSAHDRASATSCFRTSHSRKPVFVTDAYEFEPGESPWTFSGSWEPANARTYQQLTFEVVFDPQGRVLPGSVVSEVLTACVERRAATSSSEWKPCSISGSNVNLLPQNEPVPAVVALCDRLAEADRVTTTAGELDSSPGNA